MRVSRRAFVRLAGALPPLISPAGRAQDLYPSRSIRLIVPFAPGGITDTIARIAAAAMSEQLGQQMVIDNRGGAAAIIGTEAAAKAPKDGYSLLFATTSPLAANPHLYRNLPYRMEDFAPISLVAVSPWLIAVNSSIGVRNVADLITYARRNSHAMNYAMIGRGSASHIFAEMVMAATGIRATDVAYRGDGPGMTALVTNEVQLLSAGLSGPLLEHWRAGTIQIVGVGLPHRSPLAPTIPTFAEQGYPGVLATSWFGFAAPVGTPALITERLQAACVASLSSATVHDRIAATGAAPGASTPQEMQMVMREDSNRWGAQIARLGLQLD